MSNLDESEVDRFFLAGDEGSYEGGPAAPSLSPVELAEDTADATQRPTVEQLERRERLRRAVMTLVATLGAASLLAFAVRFGRATARVDDNGGHAAATAVAEPPAADTSAHEPLKNPVVASTPLPETSTTTPTPTAPSRLATTSPKSVVPSRPAVPIPASRTVRVPAHVHSNARHVLPESAPSRPTEAPRDHHAPPMASFPD